MRVVINAVKARHLNSQDDVLLAIATRTEPRDVLALELVCRRLQDSGKPFLMLKFAQDLEEQTRG